MANMEEQNPQGRVLFNILFTTSVPHILEKIFFSLDYASFKKCMEVNKSWHDLLASKSFKQIGKLAFQGEIETALWNAVIKGIANDVRTVISSGMVNIECTNKYATPPLGWTPLHVAASVGYHDVLEVLLEAGGNIDMETRNGEIPFHFAKDKRVAELLLDEGSHLHKEDALRNTPLHFASSAGHTDVVEFLLERGADPNRPNRMGETPLHIISFYTGRLGQGNVKHIAKLLIDNGADVNMVANNGGTPRTPLWFALRMGHTELADLIRENGGVE